MAFVSPAAADTSELFSIARIAGWLAHTMEEYSGAARALPGEWPLRGQSVTARRTT